MNRQLAVVGLLGALAVSLGAFGAHGLKPHLEVQQLANYRTGVHYHLTHTVVLLALVALNHLWRDATYLRIAFWFFVVGIILFSGSLYLLSTRALLGISSWKWLGPITPLGGLSLIVGWILLFLAGLRNKPAT